MENNAAQISRRLAEQVSSALQILDGGGYRPVEQVQTDAIRALLTCVSHLVVAVGDLGRIVDAHAVDAQQHDCDGEAQVQNPDVARQVADELAAVVERLRRT